MLTLAQAGATILFLAPGFYHGAETVDDLVDFIAGARARPARARERARQAVGTVSVEHGHAAGGRSPVDVRPDRAGLRRDEPRDDRRARPALAPDRRRGGRAAGRPRSRRLLRHRRLRRRCAQARRHRDRARLLAADARARPRRSSRRRPGSRATCSRCRSRTARSTRRRSASASATSPTSSARSRELRRVLAPGGRLAILEITQPRGLLAPFYRVWFDRIVPLLGKGLKGGEAYAYLPASVRRFPAPDELAALMREAGLRRRPVPHVRRRDRRAAHRRPA